MTWPSAAGAATPSGAVEPVLAIVHLPRSLIALFPGAPRRLSVRGSTVAAVIDELDRELPGIRNRLLDAGPSIRAHINVYVTAQRAGLLTEVTPGADIHIIPAVSGGAGAGPGAGGRLSHVLGSRGAQAATDGARVLEHRESLIYTLGKAAELEHLVMCQYLYAAFSMKDREDDGLAPEALAMVKRWRRDLLGIAEQEMLHLAIVQNLLTAVGASPRLARPNFPLSPRAYPAGVQMALLPFGEVALRHFAFLERPEGIDMADVDAFAALEKAEPLPEVEDAIGPQLPDFATIGHLYRSIEDGLDHLVARFGEAGLFIGPPGAQATAEHFRWEELVPVTDLASAKRGIETIVEQGEGARGDWRDAHFGRLVKILDEYLAARVADPAFEPARPVIAACVRPPESGMAMPIITDGFTNRCVDLLNAVNEILLQLLARYFAHTDETNEQLGVLADVAVTLMYGAIKPLGGLVTRLPIGPAHPGATAGPTLELFYAVDYLLPHREAAWVLMEERLRDIAELAMRCRDQCVITYMAPMAKVTDVLRVQADRLAAAR